MKVIALQTYTQTLCHRNYTLCSKKVTPFWVPFLKQLLLRNFAVDFVESCNVHVGIMIIKAVKIIFNSDMICRSYSDLNFGVTFLEHSVDCWAGILSVRLNFRGCFFISHARDYFFINFSLTMSCCRLSWRSLSDEWPGPPTRKWIDDILLWCSTDIKAQ